MAARLWTALLVLAAVFAMHGVQCVAAEAGPGHVASTGGHTVEALSLAMPGLGPAHVHAAAGAAMDVADRMAAAPAQASAASWPALPHDTAAHLWTVCLAVLAAALALLLATLVTRAVRLTAPTLTNARVRLRSATPPRPPDLAALCLLRI